MTNNERDMLDEFEALMWKADGKYVDIKEDGEAKVILYDLLSELETCIEYWRGHCD